MTLEESKKIIDKHSKQFNETLGLRNHRKYDLPGTTPGNTFRFTIRVMSLVFLQKLSRDKKVKNVFYNPSYTPPGGSPDSISLRYKVYVEYY
jgi:hypothetical protein